LGGLPEPTDKTAADPMVLPDVPIALAGDTDADRVVVDSDPTDTLWPEGLPGLIYGVFLLGKDADQPQVVPGEGENLEPLRLDPWPRPSSPDHMDVLSESGAPVHGCEDLGRSHDRDGWLFRGSTGQKPRRCLKVGWMGAAKRDERNGLDLGPQFPGRRRLLEKCLE